MSNWLIGWITGGAAVAVAAALLLWILAVVASIGKHATRALAALRRIELNTGAIWSLGPLADRLDAIVDQADLVERRSARAAFAAAGHESGDRP